jgi:RNA ligase (TIGR02306 family)
MRKLASIQKIKKLHALPQFDNLLLVEVLGWKCLVGKDQFKEGDYCVYFEVDSILPEKPEYEFMRKYNFKVKTQKMRGIYSQGLCMPVSILGSYPVGYKEGEDVTELLEVTKYEEPLPIGGEIKGKFPDFIVQKTDQRRIQEFPELLERYKDEKWIVTEKLDGCSFTAGYFNNEFIVCSRNLMLKDSGCVYWYIAKKYNLEERMKTMGLYTNADSLFIQGEIVGQKVQGNKYQLKDQRLYIFDVIRNREYKGWETVEYFAERLGIETVPVINDNYNLTDIDIDLLVSYSSGRSRINENVMREGYVIRTPETKYDLEFGRLSFKVISPEFLIKHKV